MTRGGKDKSGRPPSKTGEARDARGSDPWTGLRGLTAARIGLARSGASLATAPLLDLRLAHARARDAVHAVFDQDRLCATLGALGLLVRTAASAAQDRAQYLMRPDLGRQLASADRASLAAEARDPCDVAFVITEGLSARAMVHAPLLLAEVLPTLAREAWRVAPLVVVRQGRVAIGDAVAQALKADVVVVLIGERPGLSAPDSMGAYVTWRPRPQTSDADRNCISNIRPDGIGYGDAAFKLLFLLRAIRTQKISGVALKDATERLLISGEGNRAEIR